ncbi:MAG: uroporphyrinogen-III synthase [Chlamydiales bacterium]|nr:uroporphyrinogen-III synthase [Chlamydiales bacterium]
MKRTLYLGTSPAHFASEGHLIHYPVIKVVPRSPNHPEIAQAFENLSSCTHIIFTSKNTVAVFLQQVEREKLEGKCIIAIGRVTAAHLNLQKVRVDHVAEQESQEGIIALLETLDLKGANIFMPRSSLARPQIVHFLQEKGVNYTAVDLYDTVVQRLEPTPELRDFDEIIFTSPSTVHAFKEIFGHLPKDKKLIAIGPITEEALREERSEKKWT